MSEKRFTEEYDEEWGVYLSDNLTGDWYNINPTHIVDTCNKLWEQFVQLRKENEQLKQELNECANHKLYSRRKLEKENKELKQQLDKIPKNIKEIWLK